MSKNSSNLPKTAVAPSRRKRSLRDMLSYGVGLPLWVATSFIGAQIVAVLVLKVVESLGVTLPQTDDPVFNTVLAAAVYTLTLLVVVGVPYVLRRRVTTKADLGLTRLVSWLDIILTPAAIVIYFVLSGLLVYASSQLFPGLDLNQAQDVGFDNLTDRSQYILAFVTLVVVAPVAEEVLFRGYLFGKLKKHVPLVVAMLLTSALFGAAHGQWNVALDTFALSMVLCSLREVTGSIWAGVLLHMSKNGIAFYFLFINPTLLHTLGG